MFAIIILLVTNVIELIAISVLLDKIMEISGGNK